MEIFDRYGDYVKIHSRSGELYANDDMILTIDFARSLLILESGKTCHLDNKTISLIAHYSQKESAQTLIIL